MLIYEIRGVPVEDTMLNDPRFPVTESEPKELGVPRTYILGGSFTGSKHQFLKSPQTISCTGQELFFGI